MRRARLEPQGLRARLVLQVQQGPQVRLEPLVQPLQARQE